jgi:hypothetical protein
VEKFVRERMSGLHDAYEFSEGFRVLRVEQIT